MHRIHSAHPRVLHCITVATVTIIVLVGKWFRRKWHQRTRTARHGPRWCILGFEPTRIAACNVDVDLISDACTSEILMVAVAGNSVDIVVVVTMVVAVVVVEIVTSVIYVVVDG